jgi:uncharacterized protein (DUF1697 family)
MPSRIALLRGINLGANRRVPMAELRELLGDAGYGGVRTYVQSGNVVLDSDQPPEQLEAELGRRIAERFGLEVPVISRTREELAAVVALNPLGDVAHEPKRYQVSFLSEELWPEKVEELQGVRVDPEALHVEPREIYAWHPDGVARSRLWNKLAGTSLGVTATARNWTTVCTLLEMTSES